MLKKIIISIFILLPAFFYTSCINSIEPANQNETGTVTQTIEINVNPDSLIQQKFPKYSVDYSTLKLKGIDINQVKYFYPDPNFNIEVDNEFIIAANDSFEVEIKNCKSNYIWIVDLGNVDIADNNWINSEVSLSQIGQVVNPDSTINYRFIFHSLNAGKGYITFIEEKQPGVISSNESHGLLVGYTIDALSKITLNIQDIKWNYQNELGTFSTVSVKIKGTTNVFRLRAMTYGDGAVMAMEIPVQSNNYFESEIPVAFSFQEGVTLTTSTKLILYGTVGLPRIIALVNPKSK